MMGGMLTPEEGARTTLYAALAPPDDDTDCAPRYFDECKCKQPSDVAVDPDMQRRMWDFSWQAVKDLADPVPSPREHLESCGAPV